VIKKKIKKINCGGQDFFYDNVWMKVFHIFKKVGTEAALQLALDLCQIFWAIVKASESS
jgi:hypothetical protein